MVTAAELRKFAKEHGFIIHPTRDLESWAEKINENEGHCVCDSKRECPCPESVQEVREGERGCCICTFFVSERYLEENRYIKKDKKWIKSKRQTKKSLY